MIILFYFATVQFNLSLIDSLHSFPSEVSYEQKVVVIPCNFSFTFGFDLFILYSRPTYLQNLLLCFVYIYIMCLHVICVCMVFVVPDDRPPYMLR